MAASDEQLGAEQVDEDLVGRSDAITSDEADLDGADFPPDRPLGVPFADADVTDESLAERHAREEPEVWEAGPNRRAGSGAADEQLEQIIDLEAD